MFPVRRKLVPGDDVSTKAREACFVDMDRLSIRRGKGKKPVLTSRSAFAGCGSAI